MYYIINNYEQKINQLLNNKYPETIFVDAALFVNPKDKVFKIDRNGN